MLLGKLRIDLEPERELDRERGRFISKDIARCLTEFNRENMMPAYPSLINLHSLELIVEVIGNNHLRGQTNRFSFEVEERKLRSALTSLYPDLKFKEISFKETNFCEASSNMIYCYKQDDYLIPDSDPHDVMSSENFYNTAAYTFLGRFLPMIKLWCDLVQNSNRLLTAFLVEDRTTWPIRQEFEFKAFSELLVNEEVATLSHVEVAGFRPFNKYYKVLVSDRTMLPITVSPIVKQLNINMQLCSRSVYVFDVVDSFYCAEQDPQFFPKLAHVLKELKGSTLVVLIDVPNHFLVTTNKETVETDALQKQLHNTDELINKIDTEFDNNMTAYCLGDIDDALDFPPKTTLIRQLTTALYKKAEKENKKEGKLEALNRTIYTALREMNIIFAYTDVMAFKTNYVFEPFKTMADQLSIDCVELSDPSLNRDQLIKFGQSVGLAHFGISKGLDNKKILEHVGKCVDIIVSEQNNSDEKKYNYTSLAGYRYLIHNSLDYRFQMDPEGNEYFKAYKKKRQEALQDLDKLTEEERKAVMAKYGDEGFGVLDANAAIRSDDSGDIGFFRDSNFSKNRYEQKNELVVELDKMIGLTEIKRQIKEFKAFVELNKVKESKGLKPIPISKHMVFMGNPGTAKTTVALQLAKILNEAGLIPTDQIKHVSRDDLVGKYVGWTARLVKEAIEDAKGGILFVDEAYALTTTEGGTNSYGQEAINTFVNYMDKADIRDSTIIIFAGYREEMKQFIDTNPGLKSRIGFRFDFPDYTTDELIEIAKIQAKSAEYQLTDEYLEKLRAEINRSRGAKDFGNGRFVRNIFEKSILKMSLRLNDADRLKDKNYTKEELITVTGEDFSTTGMDVSTSKKHVGFKSKVQAEQVE